MPETRQDRYRQVLSEEMSRLRADGVNPSRAQEIVGESLRRLFSEPDNLDRSGKLSVSNRTIRNAIDEVRQGL